MQLPKKACNYPGCGRLVSSGSKCSEHKRTHASKHSEMYTTPQYRQAAKTNLQSHPWCCDPLDRHRHTIAYRMNPGQPVPATVLGHRIAHKGDERLFWDQSNWIPLCKPCNSAMCVEREGGFGNVIPKTGLF
jgi:5-methylcytosine-specific restriction protein A